MKRIIALLLVLVMVFGLAACGEKGGNNAANTNTNNAAPAEPKILRMAHKGDTTGLLCQTVTFTSSNTPMATLLYDRLVEYDAEKNTVRAMLATKWEILDAQHIRFTLRDDVVAHDGSKFTAKDVLYTLKLGQDSGVVSNYYKYWDIPNCKVEDDTHIVVATKAPEPFALYTLSNIPLAMVVEEAVNKGGGVEGQKTKPTAGTGPYKLVEWKTGSSLTFERNENYWGTKPYYDKVVINITKDESARVNALLAGDVDICLDPETAQIAALAANSKMHVINEPTTQVTTLFFNCTKAPFDDENFRKAVALAIDYEACLKLAATGYGSLTDSFLPKSSNRYVSPAKGGYTSYLHRDVAKAKEYLAKSKYADSAKFELLYAESPVFKNYTTMIQQQLAEVGITCTPVPEATASFRVKIAEGNFEAQMINASNPDPAIQVAYYDHREGFKSVQGGTGWTGPAELDTLIDQAKSETNDAKALEIYGKIQKIINEAVPAVALYNPTKTCATRAEIKGIMLTEFGDIDASKAYE